MTTAARRTRAVPVNDTRVMALHTRSRRADAGNGLRSSWSRARLSAAIAATRSARTRAAADGPFGDEIEFFASSGFHHHVAAGATLVQRGRPMDEVHLVQRGAVAVVGEHHGRRPILSFAAPSEFCCAVLAWLHEPAPWDAVTVIDSSVITVPTTTFTSAVRDRWADRWSTRSLSWLAEIGARVADLDGGNVDGQVAALLLRQRGELSLDLWRQTIADLLDVDEEVIRQVLADLEQLGAVRFAGGCVFVAQPEILQATVAAGRRAPGLAQQQA